MRFPGLNNDPRDAFSDGGLLAFQATFTDGTAGIFVADTNDAQPPQLFGDFNKDGVVGAADYVVWRKGSPQTYLQSDYNLWRANFGATQSGMGTSRSPVPEPGSVAPLSLLLVSGMRYRRHTKRCTDIDGSAT